MRVLVVGCSGSGKSAYAERLACRLSPQRTYLATMRNLGSEARERIAKHRKQRAGLGFCTIECSDTLPAPDDGTPKGVVLLDDLGNLAANALFDDSGTMGNAQEVLDRLEQEVLALQKGFEHMVVVGILVGAEGRPSFASTYTWVELVGSLSCRLAAQFDTVVEVAAGIPCVVKGQPL